MASLNCSGVTIKYLLFIFNLLFVITGIIILAIGVTIKATYSTYESFLSEQYFSTPNLLIAIGSLIFFIAFFGCCGAIKQNYCMVITFSVFLILIFILEFAAGISGYVLKSETGDYLEKTLKDNIEKYEPGKASEITLIWDLIQNDFDCCGVYNYTDWEKSVATNKSLPMSCCKIPPGAVGNFSCTAESAKDSLKMHGCITGFKDFISSHAVTIGGVGLIFAAIQVLAIIFSCTLAKKVKETYVYM